MKQNSDRSNHFLHSKMILVVAGILCIIAITTSSFEPEISHGVNKSGPGYSYADSVESVKAFMQVYSVLMSPRCMNCHPSGDIPLQGDDSHLHTMNPQRGKEGKGIYSMKCANCHQPENTPGLHTPPGNPNWHLPPADMKMIFEGRTAHQLAKQIMDPNQNGHKSKEKLIEHADDGLVLAGWNPGEGRSVPPMSHADFKKAWITWIENGGFAPPAK